MDGRPSSGGNRGQNTLRISYDKRNPDSNERRKEFASKLMSGSRASIRDGGNLHHDQLMNDLDLVKSASRQTFARPLKMIRNDNPAITV